jgi:hypothetical protein
VLEERIFMPTSAQTQAINDAITNTQTWVNDKITSPETPGQVAIAFSQGISKIGTKGQAPNLGANLTIGLPGLVFDVVVQSAAEGVPQGATSSIISSVASIGVATLVAASLPATVPAAAAGLAVMAASFIVKRIVDTAVDYAFENREQIAEAVQLGVDYVQNNIQQMIDNASQATGKSSSEITDRMNAVYDATKNNEKTLIIDKNPSNPDSFSIRQNSSSSSTASSPNPQLGKALTQAAPAAGVNPSGTQTSQPLPAPTVQTPPAPPPAMATPAGGNIQLSTPPLFVVLDVESTNFVVNRIKTRKLNPDGKTYGSALNVMGMK